MENHFSRVDIDCCSTTYAYDDEIGVCNLNGLSRHDYLGDYDSTGDTNLFHNDKAVKQIHSLTNKHAELISLNEKGMRFLKHKQI